MSSDSTSQSLYDVLAGDKALRERLESIGGAELLAVFETRVTETQNPPPPVPVGKASLKAATCHTFVASELDAPPSEVSAVLAASAGLTVSGELRLRLEDTTRGAILDAALNDALLSPSLQVSERADADLLLDDSADADAMTSAWMRTFLRNQTVSLARQSTKRLAAGFAARSAMRLVTRLGKNVPQLAELKRLSDLAELVEPLRIMVGLGDPRETLKKDRFAGRDDELRKLRIFVDTLNSESILETVSRGVIRAGRSLASAAGQGQPRLMMISAPGGFGKSTLVAKFALDHAVSNRTFPFAYLDFDRATLQPRNPSQLLIETARQIALYFPDAAPGLMVLREEMRAGLEGSAPVNFDVVCERFRRTLQSILSQHGGRTFLLILDTFELVQSDPRAVEGVARFLGAMARGPFPELAIVVSGRAEVKEFCEDNERFDGNKLPWSLTKLELGPLNLSDAVQMVDLLGESLINDIWRHNWARKIAGRRSDPASRREPLTLRIAVEVVRDALPTHREAIAEEIAKLGEQADDTFVGRLYEKRIIDHISDNDARKLAWPGLVVRRITRDVARNVLAPLCDLTSEQADNAFDRLGREVWIVDRDGDVLRHRADLRARTLPLMRRRDSQRFGELASAMVDYHTKLGSDPQNIAEAAYYRLLRGDDPSFLAAIWSPDVASALASARDDFEIDSAGWLHLTARLATRLLPLDTFKQLPDALVWGHVARSGGGLRQLDDAKIDPRILDLMGRPAPAPGSLAPDIAAVRQSVLIKSGAWSIVEASELMFPTNHVDTVAAAFFATIAAATGQASTEGWVARHPDLVGRLRDVTLQTTWQALAYSLLPALLHDRELYGIVDQRLADALSAVTVWRSASRAALRTVMSFGTQSMPRALAIFSGIAASEPSGQLSGSISTAELRALAHEADLPGSEPLVSLARRWLEDGVARRITEPEVLTAARQMIVSLAQQQLDPSRALVIRRFASARSEGWVVPIGYAIARSGNLDEWSETIGKRISAQGQDGAWMKWVTGAATRTQMPRDPIRLALLADETGDLAGFLEETSHLLRHDDALRDIKLMSLLLPLWNDRVKDLTDGYLSEDRDTASV